MNLYVKLSLVFLLLVLVIISGLYFFANREIENVLEDEILTQISQQSTNSINNIDRFIFQRLSDVRTFAKDPTFRETDQSPQKLNERLVELEQSNELYYSFSFFNMNRMRLADSRGLSVGKQHGYRIYWSQITPDSDVVMDVSKSESVGKVVLHFASVVRDYDFQASGVVVGRVLIDRLYDVINDIARNLTDREGVLVDLINNEGEVLFSSHDPGSVLNEVYDDVDLQELRAQPLTDQVRILESGGFLYFLAEEKGYLNFVGNGWSLIIKMPKEAVFTPLYEVRTKLLWILIPILISAVLFALVVANYFAKPIVKLSKAAEQIGKGNLDIDLNVNSKDEIGVLAQQFAATSQKLIHQVEEQKALNQQLHAQHEAINKQTQQIEEQNAQLNQVFEEVKDKNKQITTSINYAKRIQSSMLPGEELIKQNFADAFIFYQPKDIVSGDFYWFEEKKIRNKDYLFIASADSTGHGVPGAIMSILGSNALSNVVNNKSLTDPGKILEQIDQTIHRGLRYGQNGNGQEGIEMGLVVLDKNSLKMTFAGGGLPMYHFRDQQFTDIKPNKVMLGGFHMNGKGNGTLKIDNHNLQLQPGDCIYLFTDGYQDQFGGPNDKRYLSKQFKFLLSMNHHRKMSDQKRIIEKTFLEWKGDNAQTDDILVIGLKV